MYGHTTKEINTSILVLCTSWQKCNLIGFFFEQKDWDFVVSLLSGPEVKCMCLSHSKFKFGSVLQISISLWVHMVMCCHTHQIIINKRTHVGVQAFVNISFCLFLKSESIMSHVLVRHINPQDKMYKSQSWPMDAWQLHTPVPLDLTFPSSV
jgi:hypothetical protein